MNTLRTTVRVAFLVLVMVTYAKKSYAGPNWGEYCNAPCIGTVRAMSCQFIDFADYDYGVADESTCGDSEYGDAQTEAYARYWWICRDLAGGPPPEYASFSINCTDVPTQGSFSCWYPDVTCGS
jgi:hypothetical protein